MPPLTELSVNRPGKTRPASLFNGLSTTSAKPRPASLALDKQHTDLPAASAIQSMLKNTTELGDIASYVAKATKLPRQRSSTIGLPRDHHYHGPRGPYTDYTAGTYLDQRRHHPSDYHRGNHSLRHNPSLGSQDQHSSSLTQSSPVKSQRLSVHLSLRSTHPHRHPVPRPRSPFVYPSRLKRPGYRPSSPAFSEVNRSDSALHTGTHRAYSTRTISPQSTSSMKRLPTVWNHAFNRSDPLLQHYHSVPLSRRHDINRSPPLLRHGPLRRSPLGSHRSSVISKSQVPDGSGLSSGAGAVPLQTPLFYDYSEAFEKESFHHTVKRSSMFVARPVPQSDGSSEGYQTDVTNTSNTFANYSTSSTEFKTVTPERASAKVKRPSPLRLVAREMKLDSAEHHKDSQGAILKSMISKDAFITPPEEQSDDSFALRDPDGDNLSSSQISELSSSKGKMVDPFAVPSANLDELQYPPSAYNPAPKIIKSATLGMRLSSSSSGSQYSTSVHAGLDQTSDPMDIKVPSMTYERQPKALSISFNRLELAAHGAVDTETQQRSASLDNRVRPEPYQIFAPVPERSQSSRDSRDRFSRILSIGDDFGKRDLFTSVMPNKRAPMTIQQYLRDKKSHSPNTIASSTKELPRLPDDSPPVPDKGKGKETDELDGICHDGGQLNQAEKTLNRVSDAFPIKSLEQPALITGFARPGIPPRYSSISRNSMVEQPGPSLSVRTSILSQKPSTEPPLQMFALPKRNSSLYQIMKELPPLPTESVVSIPPPQTPIPLELPYRFTPLMPVDWLDTAVADMSESPKRTNATDAKEVVKRQTPTRILHVGVNSEQGASASPASARPWNLDASYPWAGTPPKLEVSMPQIENDPTPEVEKLPRYRLKLQHSSVLGHGSKITKSRPPNIKVLPSPATITQPTAVHTRFKEGPENIQLEAPVLALVPPSPGLKIEAQSFFSDDSSQKRRKGSLRRRLSQIRGMAMRTASLDNIGDSGPAHSPLVFGWSGTGNRQSKQSPRRSDEKSRHKSRRSKIFDKVRSWFRRHEMRIKNWRSRLDSRNARKDAFSTNP
ncbi:MAG: hypothetical protein Q9182_000016 [Xanthomendoza sp. 2 TL-2023]